jgi:transcriptional regulator with XRE-family HTH domain
MGTREEVGRRILLRRRELGWTQTDLAARCGFHYQVICGVERGRQTLTMERLAAVAHALRISADYLLGLGESLPGPLDAEQRGGAPP